MIVEGLVEKQPDITKKVSGPKKEAAFDKDGEPTKALSGFMKSKGITLEDIKFETTKKGEQVYAEIFYEGWETKKRLEKQILPELISADLFKKTMCWSTCKAPAFARPVHWLLALYGGEVVDVSFGNINSGSTTRGHRFLSDGNEIEITGASDYVAVLKGASVIVDPAERTSIIAEGIEKAAKDGGGTLLPDDGLLKEVVNLVEFPVVLRGGFDEEFLNLPREVIVNAMRAHQRYFSVVDSNGELLPYFITVANIAASDPKVVINGNERVLRARLNDAMFYFEQDSKVKMDEWVEGLKGVVFQAKLGTSYEKVERFTKLACDIGGLQPIENRPDLKNLERAARLSKADLVSGMVMEFPKLQGYMGSVYAERAGEPEEVSIAIREHYMPIAAGAELPSTTAGATISIADKMDTIAGCFGVGLIPTGTQDPYALRRAALGILAMIENGSVGIALEDLIEDAVKGIGKKLTRDGDEVNAEIREFFKERLKNRLQSDGLSFDSIDAVLSLSIDRWSNLGDAVARMEALEAFKSHPKCVQLIIALKRVSNMLKGKTINFRDKLGTITNEYEKALDDARGEIDLPIIKLREKRDYAGVFEKLITLIEPIDDFFNKLMVMHEDSIIKNHRLCILDEVQNLYIDIADLSKLTVEGG